MDSFEGKAPAQQCGYAAQADKSEADGIDLSIQLSQHEGIEEYSGYREQSKLAPGQGHLEWSLDLWLVDSKHNQSGIDCNKSHKYSKVIDIGYEGDVPQEEKGHGKYPGYQCGSPGSLSAAMNSGQKGWQGSRLSHAIDNPGRGEEHEQHCVYCSTEGY